MCRALALARGGEHARATAEVKDVLKLGNTQPAFLCGAAAVCALSSASTRENGLKERYAVRAVRLLEDLVSTGFRDGKVLKADPDLASLRQRKDFAELLKGLSEGQ